MVSGKPTTTSRSPFMIRAVIAAATAPGAFAGAIAEHFE